MVRPRYLIVVLPLISSVLGCAAPRGNAASDENALLARANEWVDTWNKRDVERMRGLHAKDVASQLYVIGDQFDSMEKLLKAIREENFWNLSWSIEVVQPRVRLLGANAALVAFRLVGDETHANGSTRPFSAAFTLVFERKSGDWEIVHVHDSSAPAPGAATAAN